MTAVYFAAASLIIVIPSGVQLFAWLTTLVTGRPEFRTPLLWIAGHLALSRTRVVNVLGGAREPLVVARADAHEHARARVLEPCGHDARGPTGRGAGDSYSQSFNSSSDGTGGTS